ncbi:NUDIX hydrolase [Gracilimonas sp.]|uniref:NUDIX hydrolase n=1 Tax=Gracilimonas sp. TaxID=1974203 RepID=UPI002872A31F|nr:CoA pyrophosphatase [Gracilimonas sp.]
MSSFKSHIQSQLNNTLPGREAQRKMAPTPVNGKNNPKNYEPANDDFRNSSVLVPIITWKDELQVLFTLRTQSINHGGQLSFPGGGKEGDETIEETALREAQEEIGLNPEKAEIIGRLTPLYVGHSDNMVTPVIAFIHHKQEFTPNPNEVDEIITVPLKDFIHKDKLVTEKWSLRDVPYHVPFWKIHHVPLWGATAMMMSEFVEISRPFFKNQ